MYKYPPDIDYILDWVAERDLDTSDSAYDWLVRGHIWAVAMMTEAANTRDRYGEMDELLFDEWDLVRLVLISCVRAASFD